MEAVPPGGIFRNGVTAGNTVELPPTQAERDIAPLVNRGLGQVSGKEEPEKLLPSVVGSVAHLKCYTMK